MSGTLRIGLVALGAATLLAASLASEVSAQTFPVVRVMAGNGFDEAYGVGIGGSAGLEIPFFRGKRFFVGARGMYHLGSDGQLPGFAPEGAADPTGSVSQLQTGVEIGATWMASPVFIRTVGGLGVSRVSVGLDSGESDLEGTSYKLQYGPGLLLALPSDDGGTLTGIEIRWLKVSDLQSALSVYVTLGRRLF
jgi:hypothetical protein